MQFWEVALFASKVKINFFRTEWPGRGLWSKEFFFKNVDFSIWGTHIIYCTIFPFLAQYASFSIILCRFLEFYYLFKNITAPYVWLWKYPSKKIILWSEWNEHTLVSFGTGARNQPKNEFLRQVKQGFYSFFANFWWFFKVHSSIGGLCFEKSSNI